MSEAPGIGKRGGPYTAVIEGPKARRPGITLKFISQYLSMVVAFAGLLVLLAWVFQIPYLKSLVPGAIPMKANAALCFVFTGVAIWLLRVESPSSHSQKVRRYIAYCLALLIAAIGLLTLLEYVFGWDAGIDQLVAREYPVAAATSNAGRMAPYAALSFLITGISLLLLDVKSRRGQRPAQYLISVVALIGLSVIIGYIYNAREFLGVPPYTPLALDAAAGFVLVYLAVIMARPNAGLAALLVDDYPANILPRFMIPVFTILLVLTGRLWLQSELLGHFSDEFGAALFTLINIVAISAVIMIAAIMTSNAERRSRQADLKVQELNSSLERQVAGRTTDLRKSERKYRSIFENSVEGIFQSTLEGRYISVNPAFAHMAGFDSPEDMMNSISDIRSQVYVHPEDLDRLIESLRSSGAVSNFEAEIRHRDGSTIWVSMNIRPVSDQDGEIIYLEGMQADISERKQAEQKLRESEARYRELFDHMASSVTVYEALENGDDFIIRDFNRSAERLEKVRKEDIVGRSVRDVFPGLADFDLFDVFSRVWRTGVPEQDPISLYRDSRIANWRDNYVYKLPSGQIVAIHEDITERKQAEEKLQEKTLKLERSNTELERFAYVASHDLQEPLRTISSYLQLLERRYREKLDERATRYIDFTVEAANRLQNMISGMLEYSRVETRGQPFEPVNTEAVLRETIDNLRRTIDESKAEITHGLLPTVLADRIQLIRVFQNLLANSIRYRGEEAPVIYVSAEKTPGEWVFSVKDNGIGFDPEYREQIFAIFQRLHGRDVPGIGLGLSVAKRIVERHGGRIWVESQPAKGATFYFTVPDEGGKNK